MPPQDGENSYAPVTVWYMGGFIPSKIKTEDRPSLRKIGTRELENGRVVDVHITKPLRLKYPSTEDVDQYARQFHRFISDEKDRAKQRSAEMRSFLSITPSPDNPWIMASFNFRYHSMYHVHLGKTWEQHVPNGLILPVGYSMDSHAPIYLKVHRSGQNLPDSVIQNAQTFDTSGGFILKTTGPFTTSFIPLTSLYRNGQIQALKQFLVKSQTDGWKPNIVQQREIKELEAFYVRGLPLWIPSFASVPASAIAKLEHLGLPRMSRQFHSMGFDTSDGRVPSEAVEIIRRFIKKHPDELLFEQTLAQGVCWYLRCLLTTNFSNDMGSETEKEDIKFAEHVPIGDFLLTYHAYLSWHQTHQVAFFKHPFRWTRQSFDGDKWEVGYDEELERLLIIMAPLALFPVGSVLPCSMPGSTQPDITQGTGYIGSSDDGVRGAMNLPDWRTLYFPSFHMTEEKKTRGSLTSSPMKRNLCIPRCLTPNSLGVAVEEPTELRPFSVLTTGKSDGWAWDATSSISDQRPLEPDKVGAVAACFRNYSEDVPVSPWSRANLQRFDEALVKAAEYQESKGGNEDYNVRAFGRWMSMRDGRIEQTDQRAWHQRPLQDLARPVKRMQPVELAILPDDGTFPDWVLASNTKENPTPSTNNGATISFTPRKKKRKSTSGVEPEPTPPKRRDTKPDVSPAVPTSLIPPGSAVSSTAAASIKLPAPPALSNPNPAREVANTEASQRGDAPGGHHPFSYTVAACQTPEPLTEIDTRMVPHAGQIA